MLSVAQIQTLQGLYTDAPPNLVLYHGTNDDTFYSRICMRYGFQNEQMFMGAYSMRSLGGTAVYGPGIYLADTVAEAQRYGHRIVEVRPSSHGTNYLDLTGTRGTHAVTVVGAPKQNILAEARLYALIRVTNNYYVMRTPHTFVVGAFGV